jgi:SAM-dependent methyltransferase
MTDVVDDHPSGLRRSWQLLQLHRRETTDPERFYRFLATDTVTQLTRWGASLGGRTLDVGGGPGYFAREVARHGGTCAVVEPKVEEMRLHGNAPTACAVLADGQRLPFASGSFELVHCSNVLEHVRSPHALLSEIVRVLSPGGHGYLSFTPWWSPWGGHETSPWHYLGGDYAAARYERRTGVPAKNHFGSGLFEIHIPEVTEWFSNAADVEVTWMGPRYWPPSWSPIARIPVVGEVITWNMCVLFRRTLA